MTRQKPTADMKTIRALKRRLKLKEREFNSLLCRNQQLFDKLLEAKQEVLNERKKVQEWLIKRLDGALI